MTDLTSRTATPVERHPLGDRGLPPTPRPVLPPLRIGRHTIASPVVLAPMAGITNRAFRRLCREYGRDGLESARTPVDGSSCLYVSEMITSRALVERNPVTMRLIEHDAAEDPRSIQLYGVDPVTVGAAVRLLVEEDRADHIDLNFGCPVPKVTRKGGGAALPWKTGCSGPSSRRRCARRVWPTSR